MNILKRIPALFLTAAAAFNLTACSLSEPDNSEAAADPASGINVMNIVSAAGSGEKTEIRLDDSGIEINGEGASASGTTVSVAKAGTYVLSGALSEGKISVEAGKNDTVVLIFDGAEICSSSAPAVYVENAELTCIVLADGSKNIIRSGTETDVLDAENSAAEDASGGAIYAKDDLSFTGNGSLAVYGYINNGIQTSNDLVIDGGNYEITALNNGLKGKDSVTITGGSFNVRAGNDGIKSDSSEGENYGSVCISGGDFTLETMGDGIQAETLLEISGGSFSVKTGGGHPDITVPTGSDMFRGGPRDWQSFSYENSPDNLPYDFSGKTNSGNPPAGTMPDNPPEGGMPDNFRKDAENGSERTFLGDWNEDGEDTADAKGFKSGGELNIYGGSFTVDTIDDAFHSNGSVYIKDGDFDIYSGDDGIHGDLSLTVDGGNVRINQSYEGMEANQLRINGGDISINASDDGLNAYGGENSQGFGREQTSSDAPKETPDLYICGGTVYINAEGDGLDSNGSIYIEGGKIIVDGPVNDGNGAIDSGSENGGSCAVSGGTVIAAGSSGMAESFGKESSQCFFMHNFSSSVPAGSEISVADSDGNIIFSYTNAKKISSVVFSSEELKQGETYTLTAGEQKTEIIC